jgi:hypothetical protein
MDSPIELHLLKVFLEEVCDDRRYWRSYSQAMNLFLQVASGTEVKGSQDMAEEPQDILLKMSN